MHTHTHTLSLSLSFTRTHTHTHKHTHTNLAAAGLQNISQDNRRMKRQSQRLAQKHCMLLGPYWNTVELICTDNTHISVNNGMGVGVAASLIPWISLHDSCSLHSPPHMLVLTHMHRSTYQKSKSSKLPEKLSYRLD